MKDMMAVLVQCVSHCALPQTYLSYRFTFSLNGVSDPNKIAPDGQTIEGRMQNLCVAVAEEIKKCANTCDAYLK